MPSQTTGWHEILTRQSLILPQDCIGTVHNPSCWVGAVPGAWHRRMKWRSRAARRLLHSGNPIGLSQAHVLASGMTSPGLLGRQGSSSRGVDDDPDTGFLSPTTRIRPGTRGCLLSFSGLRVGARTAEWRLHLNPLSLDPWLVALKNLTRQLGLIPALTCIVPALRDGPAYPRERDAEGHICRLGRLRGSSASFVTPLLALEADFPNGPRPVL